MLFLLSSAFSLENFIFLCYTVAIRQTEGGARREKARAQAFPVVLRENGQGRHRRLRRAGLVLDPDRLHPVFDVPAHAFAADPLRGHDAAVRVCERNALAGGRDAAHAFQRDPRAGGHPLDDGDHLRLVGLGEHARARQGALRGVRRAEAQLYFHARARDRLHAGARNHPAPSLFHFAH